MQIDYQNLGRPCQGCQIAQASAWLKCLLADILTQDILAFCKTQSFYLSKWRISIPRIARMESLFSASGQACSSKFASFAFLCLSNLEKSSIVPWHGPESVLGIFGLNKETARSEPSGVYFPSSPQKSFKLGILSVTKNTRQSFHRASMCLPHLIFVNCGTSPHHLTL